jgi:hypothetical protein
MGIAVNGGSDAKLRAGAARCRRGWGAHGSGAARRELRGGGARSGRWLRGSKSPATTRRQRRGTHRQHDRAGGRHVRLGQPATRAGGGGETGARVSNGPRSAQDVAPNNSSQAAAGAHPRRDSAAAALRAVARTLVERIFTHDE